MKNNLDIINEIIKNKKYNFINTTSIKFDENDPLYSCLEYKKIYVRPSNSEKIHCENNAKELYKLLNFNEPCFDIMTSFWVPLKEEIIEKYNKRENKEEDKAFLINNAVPIQYVQNLKKMHSGKILKNLFIWMSYLTENIDIVKKYCSSNTIKFLNEIYTIGNIINVPEKFNTGRNINNNTDFWDLTMCAIYIFGYKEDIQNEKYDENDDYNGYIKIPKTSFQQLKKLFETKEVKDWLDKYNDWKTFVDKNFLKSYVDKDYKPKLFWEGHSYTNPTPKNENKNQKEENNFVEFYTNAIAAINGRTEEIYKEIKSIV